MRLIPVLFLVFAAPVAAQDTFASSENFVAFVPVQTGGVERAASSSYVAQMKLGLAPSGVTSVSSQHEAHFGTAAIPAQLSPGPPLVFAVEPAAGDKSGIEPVTIRGFNLDDGSGTAFASLGGVAMFGATTTNTVLSAVNGPGTNVHGNPLGRVDAEVITAAGSGVGSELFIYTPALTEEAAPSVGQTYLLDLHLPAGSFYQLALGTSVPGVSAPVPPLDGAAEILLGIVQLTGLVPAPANLVTLPLPIPANPGIIGVPIELQAAVLTGLAPLAGTFTNKLATVVTP